jgi:DNA-binding IclR family transcriptional regulator
MSSSPPTDRVVDVIELVAAHGLSSFSLAEIARRTGQNVATCHAVTSTLVERTWLHRDRTTKEFSLGPALLSIGSAAAAGYPAARAVRPELVALADDLGIQASSAMADGDVLTLVEVVGGQDPGKLVGRHVPLAPPFGSVFVAWASPDTQERWLAGTAGIEADHARELRRSLAATRERGYAIEWHTDEAIRLRAIITELPDVPTADPLRADLVRLLADLSRSGYLRTPEDSSQLAVSVISAPVRNRYGEVVLDVAVQPLRPLTARQMATISTKVVRAAERVQQALGGGTVERAAGP